MRYAVLSKPSEWADVEAVMQSLGSTCPEEGQGVIFAQYDGDELVAFQIVQTGLFAEGMWAKDGRANLLRLNRQALESVEKQVGKGSGRCLLTITREDATGERIGKAARYLGYERIGVVYRRQF